MISVLSSLRSILTLFSNLRLGFSCGLSRSCFPTKLAFSTLLASGQRYLREYSHLLRAGQCRIQIPVGARFSAPVQTNTGAHPGSYTMVTESHSRGGKAAGASPYAPTSIYRWGQRKSRAKSLLLLWAFMACSRTYFLYPYLQHAHPAHLPWFHYQDILKELPNLTQAQSPHARNFLGTAESWPSSLYGRMRHLRHQPTANGLLLQVTIYFTHAINS